MAKENAEIGKINQGALDAELMRWIEQDKLVIKGHPKEPEYLRLSERAKSTLLRMSLALMIPGGYTALIKDAEHLNTMYDEAVGIRSEIAADSIRTSFGVRPGQTIEGVMETEVEHATQKLGAGFSAPIQKDLHDLARAFDINPADVLQGSVPGNTFYMPHKGKAVINFEQVDKARVTITKLRTAGTANPELIGLANRFEAGLRQRTHRCRHDV